MSETNPPPLTSPSAVYTAPELDAMSSEDALSALLWSIEMGADEAVEDAPVDQFEAATSRLAVPPSPIAPKTNSKMTVAPDLTQRPAQAATKPPPMGAEEAIAEAKNLAQSADSLDALRSIVSHFDGCPLKRHAQHLVFGDGAPDADILFIGAAPGADEDRQGRPFVGESGQLFDKMLSFINLDRTRFYATYMVYWRPAGNRSPTEAEIAICAPFLAKQIAFIQPKIIIPIGGTAASTFLNTKSTIMNMRGKWGMVSGENSTLTSVSAPIPALPMLEPGYLLKTPAQKRYAWRDALSLREKMDALGIATDPL